MDFDDVVDAVHAFLLEGLGWANFSIPFVVSFVLGLLFCLAIWCAYHRASAGAALVLGTFALESSVALPTLSVALNIYVSDLLLLIIGTATLLRLNRQTRTTTIEWLWLAFGGLCLFQFVISAASRGTAAGVDFRGYFGSWVVAMYLMTFDLTEEQSRKISGYWQLSLYAFSCVALFRWVSDAFGLIDDPSWVNDTGGSPMRVLNAALALALGQGLIMAFYKRVTGDTRISWDMLLYILPIEVLLLQHRSVWVTTFATLFLFVALRGNRGKLWIQFGVVMGVVGAAAGAIVLGGGGEGSTASIISHSVSEPFQEHSTLAWRIDSWTTILDQIRHAGPVEQLIGRGFGAGFARKIEGVGEELNVAPHNYYVQILGHLGVVGFLLQFAPYVYLLYLIAKGRIDVRRDWPAGLLALLLASQLLYFIPYSAQYNQSILLGVALSLANSYSRKALPSHSKISASWVYSPP